MIYQVHTVYYNREAEKSRPRLAIVVVAVVAELSLVPLCISIRMSYVVHHGKPALGALV